MTDVAAYTPPALATANEPDPLAPAQFEHSQRIAKMFASSELVPPHMRGKIADCLIAYAIAKRTREEPLVVLQNIYFVSGRAGWSATYMIAKANRSGAFSRRINWRIDGDGKNLRVTAFATLADSGEPVEATASMAMAEAEGWTKNPKYKSMPEQMLRYRSATMLIRLFAPEVMMGLPVADEIDYAQARGPAPMRDVTPRTPAASLAAALDSIEQEADMTIATAGSDADNLPSPAAASVAAPTVAPADELRSDLRAKCLSLVEAIREAKSPDALDKIMVAARPALDAIARESETAHGWVLSEASKRLAETTE